MRSNTLVSQLQDKKSKCSPCPQHPMGTLPVSCFASVLLLALEFRFLSHQGRSKRMVCYLLNDTLYGHDVTPSVPHPNKVGSFRLGDPPPSACLSTVPRSRRRERVRPKEATAIRMVNSLISLLQFIRKIFARDKVVLGDRYQPKRGRVTTKV